MAETDSSLLKKILEELKAGYNQEAQSKEELESQLKDNGQKLYHAIAHGEVETQKVLKSERAILKEAILKAGDLSQSAVYQVGEAIKNGNDFMMGALDKANNFLSKTFDINLKQFLRMPTMGDMKQAAQWAKENAIASLKALRDLPGKIGNVFKKIPGMKTLGKIFDGIKEFMKTGLLLAGAAISLQGFLNGWKKAEEWFGANANFGEKLAAGLSGLAAIFLGLNEEEQKKLAEGIANLFNWIYDHAKKLFDGVFGGLKDILYGIFNKDGGQIWKGVKQILDTLATAIFDIAEDVLAFFVGEGQAANIVNKIRSIYTSVMGFIERIGPDLIEWAKGMMNGFITAFDGVTDVVMGVFSGDMTLIKEGIGKIWDAIVMSVTSTANAIISIFNLEGVVEKVKEGFDFVTSIPEKIKEAMTSIITGIGDWVRGAINSAWASVTETWDSTINIAQTIIDSVMSLGDMIVGYVKSGFDQAVNLVSNTFSSMYDGMINIINGVIRKVNAALDWVPGLGADTIAEIGRTQGASSNVEGMNVAFSENKQLVDEASQWFEKRTGISSTAPGVVVNQPISTSNTNVAAKPKAKPGVSNPYTTGGSHWFWGPNAYN